MSERARHRHVGSPIGAGTVVAVAAAVAIALAGYLVAANVAEHADARRLRIATGSEAGTYHAIGLALQRQLLLQSVAGDVTVLPSQGSTENARRLAAGEVDLAFVQSDVAPPANARLVAPLYDEVLHVLTRPGDGGATTLRDLAGRRVAIGSPGSGTRAIAERMLAQFDITPKERLALPLAEVEPRLLAGELDAAFVLTAAPSPLVDRLCDRGAGLISLGDPAQEGNLADAVHAATPALVPQVLPQSLYGQQPRIASQAIAVSALLVARRDLPDAVVRDVAQLLFEHRVALAADERAGHLFARLRERHEPDTFLIPYHDGAVAWFDRKQPPFLVEYAETTSMLLTVLAGGISLLIGIGKWIERRRKNRIDAYYNEVRELAEAGDDARAETRRKLLDVRQRAFADLIEERVEANESFTIFQDYVTHELDRLT